MFVIAIVGFKFYYYPLFLVLYIFRARLKCGVFLVIIWGGALWFGEPLLRPFTKRLLIFWNLVCDFGKLGMCS